MSKSYIRLDINDKSSFSKVMDNMLSVWDNHSIYICHPSHIFRDCSDFENVEAIDWDCIDVNKMFKKNNYKSFLSFDHRDAFRYVHKRLGSEIMGQAATKGKDAALSYLAVVERYRLNNKDNYLVRGIIRGDMTGYSIAFNPEYESAIPNDIFEKFLRIDEDEDSLPHIYRIERN